MKRRKKSTRNSLATVRKFFPQVEVVLDATEPLAVHVTKADERAAHKKDHTGCPAVVACKREQKADGVVMAISTAYVIHGKTATRYLIPPSVSREIVAYDRGAGFAPGEYQLSAVNPSRQFGVKRWRSDRRGNLDGSRSHHIHMTENIRTTLRHV